MMLGTPAPQVREHSRTGRSLRE